MKKKTVALLLSLVLVVGCVVGGTLAWLIAGPKTITNTFTTSNIDITLEETGMNDKGENSYKMIPGVTIAKDPKVTVVEGSEPCYLFVKIEKTDNFEEYMTYKIDPNWTALDGENGVYYRKIESADKQGIAYSVLDGDKVTVLNDVTKEKMGQLTTANYPKLTVTAYASQLMNDTKEFTPAEAWTNVNP